MISHFDLAVFREMRRLSETYRDVADGEFERLRAEVKAATTANEVLAAWGRSQERQEAISRMWRNIRAEATRREAEATPREGE